MDKKEIEEFRKRVIDSPSRIIGESLSEGICNKLYGYKPSHKHNYDAVSEAAEKIEYKSCRILHRDNIDKNKSVFDRIMSAKNPSDRLGSLADIESGDIEVNVQNIKTQTFDILIYILIGIDGFDIYKITREIFEEKVKNGEFTFWSAKHGSAEKKGKNGQFHINSKNINWHSQFKIDHLDWVDVAEMAKEIY